LEREGLAEARDYRTLRFDSDVGIFKQVAASSSDFALLTAFV
jgi:hypothetical protein